MYQYPYTEAPSESYQLPSWLSNYYSNREAGLFGSESNKFFESRPVLTYSEQAAQTPMFYSSPKPRRFDTNAPTMEDIEAELAQAGTVNSWEDWASALATGLGIVSNPVAGMFGLGLNMAMGRNATNMSTFDALASEFAEQTGYAATPAGIEAAVTDNRGTWGAFADFFGFGENISDIDIDYADIADITSISNDVTESGEGAASSWSDAVSGLADGYDGYGVDEGDESSTSGFDFGDMSDWGGGGGGGGGAGGGGGGGAGTYICTAAYANGVTDYKTFSANRKYGINLRRNDPYLMKGYDLVGPRLAKMFGRTKIARVLTNYYKMDLDKKVLSFRYKLLQIFLKGIMRPVVRTIGYLDERIFK